MIRGRLEDDAMCFLCLSTPSQSSIGAGDTEMQVGIWVSSQHQGASSSALQLYDSTKI